jgi:RNA polymerase sigma-70 factor, ECF subfamily
MPSSRVHDAGREIASPRPCGFHQLSTTVWTPGPALVAVTGADSLSDVELAARVATGDEWAFGAAYDRYAGAVYGAIFRFVRDQSVAEEVVQDAYVALWRSAQQYDPAAGSLLSWLLRIARNKAIDRVRSSARRPRTVDLSAPDGNTAALELALRNAGANSWAADAPDEAAVRAWTRSVVRTALSLMPENERLTLELAYDEGLTLVEIASRTGWPLGTVKTRTRRALANLRTALAGVPELVEETGGAMIGDLDGAR